jgi:aryl-alcohol dehydrogenase-like predicted oxidoreductase
MVEAVYVAKELGTNRFVCEQPPYNLLDRRIEREMIPVAQTYGIALIPWSPIAGGLLTGKYVRGQEPPEGARFADQSNPIYRRRMTERIYDVIEPLQELAGRKGVALSQMALAWVTQRPGVTSSIIGPRTMEQLEDNLGSWDITFTEDELKEIDRIIRPGDYVAPYYEADFGPSQFRRY